jgi:ADP-ribose pyrophosphatase
MQEAPVAGETARPPADFYVIHPPDWVNVVALLPDDRVVLIEQWRHGVLHPTLEIPGGVIEAGEDPGLAAQRELAEETGYTASTWKKIGVVEPNPAIQSNRCHTYLAIGCQPGPTRFDEHERIQTHLFPFEEALTAVAQGRIDHALCVAGLMFAWLDRRGSK